MNDNGAGRVLVVGSGAGALATAADLAGKHEVVVWDLPRFHGNLRAIAAAGGVKARFRDSFVAKFPVEPVLCPVEVSYLDVAEVIPDFPVVIVSVPSFGHRTFADLLAPKVAEDQTVIWSSEGGGALSAMAACAAAGVAPRGLHAETNTLPYSARVREPAGVDASRKSGGTLIAAIPSGRTEEALAITSRFWPWIAAAENVWETVLTNFNAIDHVATALMNVGTVERPGSVRLWGEGGSPGVVRVLMAVDAEFRALRAALGVSNSTTWEEYLVAQGMAPVQGETAHETLHASALVDSEVETGPGFMDTRFISEDIPYGLVLASDLGRHVSVGTPVIDSLIEIGSVAAGRSFRGEGRTLESFGLGGAGRTDLIRAVTDGTWRSDGV